jgi:undecaprenyl diphosphate synthase
MIPQHVAIIMDGNRRWAKKRGLPILAGHRQVVNKVLKSLISHAKKLGVKYLTLWAFSTENWQRDKKEVLGLLSLFRDVLKTKIEEANKEGIRLNVIGDISDFPKDIQEGIKKGIAATAQNQEITVNFALNYGGRDEIIRAIKKYQVSSIKYQVLTEETFAKFLDTAGMPEPDLIIRTGGEMRLSGFMSWQSAYSELYFTKTLMPDFTPKELDKAIAEFQKRQRRFGK